MSTVLSPLPVQKFFSNNGEPLVKGLLFTYTAGTTTKVATYTDETGGSVNTNPIVLDYRGECRIWLDPALSYKFVLSPPNDTDPPTNPIWSVDDISTLVSSSTIGQLLYPKTPEETAAGAVIVDYAVPSNVIGIVLQERYATIANAVAVSDQALLPLVGLGSGSVSSNVVLGRAALTLNTTGSENVAIGKSALEVNTTGGDNTAVGFGSLRANTTGEKNTSIGSHNMESNVDGSFNTAVGENCLDFNTSGDENTAVGQGALFRNETGSQNTAVGEHALLTNVSANDNTACGAYALEDCTGANNVGVGRNAGLNISTGHENTAVGKDSLNNCTTASENTAVGHGALSFNTAAGNTAVGQASLTTNSTGTANTACGHRALANNTTGAGHTAVGEDALVANVTADFDTAVGKNALGATTGAANTAIGHSAGLTNTTGSTNTFIGYTADADAGNYTNTTAIGNAAVCTASNQITLGNASISVIRAQVTTITALSDIRFKKNVRLFDIPDGAIEDIAVVIFEWINDGMPPGPQVGVIAQGIDAWQVKWGLTWLQLVDKTVPERWEATPGKLLLPLLFALQKLSARVAALEGNDQWRR